MGFPSFGGFAFGAVPVIVVIGFALAFGMMFIRMIKGGIQWNRNNNSPVLTVEAQVVAKRLSVSTYTHHHNDNMAMDETTSSTTYYITFEVESGDRMELRVPDEEYGLLVEGDLGRLTFQGTRYKGFERIR